ncbi:DUF3298 and DUF4163 domain-containing protein [Brevundimonas sp.]
MKTVRALILTAAIASTLAACNRDRETSPDAPATGTASVVAPATAAAPMGFDSDTPFAKVKLTLPDAIKAQPDLHASLYAKEVQTLRQFVEGAQGERAEAGFDEDRPPYEKTIAVTAAGETTGLLSLKRMDFDYSGGAHPNTITTGILWDKTAKRQVPGTALFRAGADMTALDRALCAALNTAKAARSPGSPPVTLTGSDWSCPKAAATPFVLTGGSMPGKAAGLTFLVGPYQIGPYSDGAYEIALPASDFQSLLAPQWAGEFAGTLSRTGDVTPTR